MIRLTASLILCISTLAAQTFQVASIKPSGSDASGAGNPPLALDPAHINYTGVPLNFVLALAYGVRPDQIIGPKWLSDERFDVSATAPAGTTEAQAQVMLQSLLTQRFHMMVHEETKPRTFYALVPAPGGVKMKPSEKPEISASLDLSSENLVLKEYSMVNFANFLTNAMREPVVDETGLTGSFDIKLFVSMADIKSAKAMIAIRQLGLNLEKRNAPTKLITVEKADKTPTAD